MGLFSRYFSEVANLVLCPGKAQVRETEQMNTTLLFVLPICPAFISCNRWMGKSSSLYEHCLGILMIWHGI